MDRIEKIYRSPKRIFLHNFLGGIAWSLGTLIGATIVLALLGFILAKIGVTPLLGGWIVRLMEFINQYSPQ
jgi:hypothetical protein